MKKCIKKKRYSRVEEWLYWTLCIGFSYNMYNLCIHINIYSIKILLVKNVTNKSNTAVANNSIKLLNANAQIH